MKLNTLLTIFAVIKHEAIKGYYSEKYRYAANDVRKGCCELIA
ncbi:hypothetical protein NPIL_577421, partial [Nephila pilipes]